MERIYFDNSATTPLCPQAKEAMLAAMESYGNPSSLHSLGIESEKIVSEARRTILSSLGVKCPTKIDEKQLIFTASGTESNNLALFGTALAKNFVPGKKIIISDSEHPAVTEPAKELEKRGFTVVRIPTKSGIPDYNLIAETADKNTILASFMLVNNETGAVYDIKRISEIIKSANPEAVIHSDCVQGFMKLRFTEKSLGADLITLSAHKVNGPKGVGALYVSQQILKSRKLVPVIYGGSQESGMRSGTENVLGIAGFSAAVKINQANLTQNIEKITELRDHLITAIKNESTFTDIKLNIPENTAPHIISITLPAIKSEVMLHSLSHANIFISSGSACSSNTNHPSHVLSAYGLTPRESDCTIRLSLSAQNTIMEIERFLKEFAESLSSLVRI